MRKIKVLTWICLVVLLFSGCVDQSDGNGEQTPTPIEEEREIQDVPPTVLVDQEPEQIENSNGYYWEENRWELQFEQAEIFDGEKVVGRYMENIAYFELKAVLEPFGWICIDEEALRIQKEEVEYRFGNTEIQRIFLGERGSPYKLQFHLWEFEGKTMIAQYDMEKLFGLHSEWNPESRILKLVEWNWVMPEGIEALALGDRISARMRIEPKEDVVWILDDLPSIQLRSEAGEAIDRFGTGRSQGKGYLVESQGGDLIPGKMWTGTAWVYYHARPIAAYPLKLDFDADTGEIAISQGPWVEFTLEKPSAFYSKNWEGIEIEGTSEDDWVEILISRLEEGGFKQNHVERLRGKGSFQFGFSSKEPGIFRIDISTEKEGIMQNRTHFYYEKTKP